MKTKITDLEFEKKSALEMFERTIKSLDVFESYDFVESGFTFNLHREIKNEAIKILDINFTEKSSIVQIENKIINTIKNCEDSKKLEKFKDAFWDIIFNAFEVLRTG